MQSARGLVGDERDVGAVHGVGAYPFWHLYVNALGRQPWSPSCAGGGAFAHTTDSPAWTGKL
eukprot:3239715-Pleurochrysis_carterae.AAC.2